MRPAESLAARAPKALLAGRFRAWQDRPLAWPLTVLGRAPCFMIFLIDNYDSFTWNVYQALAALGADVRVERNDALSIGELLELAPSAIVLSPGPGTPADAGICPELLKRLPDEIPLFGVCLGHQALVEHYGGELERDPEPTHGRSSLIHHDGDELFKDLPNPFSAGRYHSLRAKRDRLPEELRLTAWTEDGLVMAVRHTRLPRFGVQFHPESILSPRGETIFERFLAVCDRSTQRTSRA